VVSLLTPFVLGFVLGAPWLAAIVWVWLRTEPAEGDVAPGWAELARQRLAA